MKDKEFASCILGLLRKDYDGIAGGQGQTVVIDMQRDMMARVVAMIATIA